MRAAQTAEVLCALKSLASAELNHLVVWIQTDLQTCFTDSLCSTLLRATQVQVSASLTLRSFSGFVRLKPTDDMRPQRGVSVTASAATESQCQLNFIHSVPSGHMLRSRGLTPLLAQLNTRGVTSSACVISRVQSAFRLHATSAVQASHHRRARSWFCDECRRGSRYRLFAPAWIRHWVKESSSFAFR